MDRGRIRHGRRARRALAAVSAAGVLLALPATASASSGWIDASVTPFQLGVSPPGQQLFDEETDVYGLRLNLLYGTNQNVAGFDLGLFSDAYALTGLQVGGGNQVKGKLYGVQLGFANSADKGAGLQIGVMNRTHSMKGLQIGILNWNDEGFLPVFPLFNFSLGGGDH